MDNDGLPVFLDDSPLSRGVQKMKMKMMEMKMPIFLSRVFVFADIVQSTSMEIHYISL
jgi:hypothetical protein